MRLPDWFDQDDEVTARAAWSRVTEPADPVAGALIGQVGAGLALGMLLTDRWPHGVRANPSWRVRLDHIDPRADLARLADCGGRLVVPGDPQWAAGLDDLGAEAPHCLWVRGPVDLAGGTGRAVALVGSRANTSYGATVTADLAAGLARAGVTVVSGAAYGIDAQAHRTTLAVDGCTVAVLAGGVDRPYPQGNATLLAAIAADGAVVSETPPGCAPTRWRFVKRNRLIAALAQVSVVVEAAARSGALGTARAAQRLSRVVAAVPGPVTSAMSTGSNELLRQPGTVCVTRVEEVLELVMPLGSVDTTCSLPVAVHDGLTPVQVQVLDAVPLRRPAPVERVAVVAGVVLTDAVAALGLLELRGLVRRDVEGWVRHSPA